MAAGSSLGSWLMVQLSDPHVCEAGKACLGAVDTAALLADAVSMINDLDPRPDLVVATGDLVNDGGADEYEHLRSLLGPLRPPLRLMTGNHDDRDLLRAWFPDHAELGVAGPCDYVIEGPVKVIALDTLVPGSGGGTLTGDQLRWLDDRLGEDRSRSTIVAMHHPPFATGIAHMDAIGLDPVAAAGLAEIVSAHPQVERIIAGHLHRRIERRWAGTVVATAPSVAHAVALDLGPGDPPAWTREPPAVVVHWWRPEIGLVAHLLPVGRFERRPFR